MNEINYKGEKPERIVYYHKTENNKHGIHIQLEKIEEPTILVYVYGKFNDGYFDWVWRTERIEINKKKNTFRVEPIDGEIKGHILVNMQGEIIDLNFYTIVLATALRLEQIDREQTLSDLKEKIKITDQILKKILNSRKNNIIINVIIKKEI